ncbi:release factor H-coupled RctB family protein [Sphingomonas kyeonggiensis]|uniref:RNA ligase RtcB family protein n=1 Tax=Sphingomonas kyeonggiensis TaxID=1268553 RepID=UPI00277FBE07|nr:RNA ligase RtcB family protein [Sphingomonas kyeonggiensis]MDQ0251238.1 release factor H-coupled RctB family protein [Sphingomonas kyeonggiensis]
MTTASIHIVASPESWIEQLAIEQLHQTAALPGIEAVVGLPDLHAGRGIAVGAAFWSRGLVYPHLVGSDIGCGMGLWRTGMKLRKFRPDTAVRKLHGLEEAWEGDVAARLAEADLPALPCDALGTIGGGNHFAELLRFEEVFDADLFAELGLDARAVHLMVHSGSRGLGQAILDRHRARHNVDGLATGTSDCVAYLAEHDAAVRWAMLNRVVIAERFLDRLGAEGARLLDICHNSVTPHRDGWLHRKGAAPADKGLVVIPGSRGDMTYLVRPRPGAPADAALDSLAHGAGRKWSRSEARDKLGRRFRIADLERTALGSRVICEDRDLIFEEAPQAYKDIHQVVHDLEQHGLVDLVATLRPLVTYKTRRA